MANISRAKLNPYEGKIDFIEQDDKKRAKDESFNSH